MQTLEQRLKFHSKEEKNVWLTLNAEKNDENRFTLHLIKFGLLVNYVLILMEKETN